MTPNNQYGIRSFLITLCMLPRIFGTEITPGLDYELIQRNKPAQSIHILRVDPRIMQIRLGIADDKCASALTTHAIARQQNVLAAVNAGFFDFGCTHPMHNYLIKFLDCLGCASYKAYPIWTLKVNHLFYSVSPLMRGVIAWKGEDQRPLFGELNTIMCLVMNGCEYTVPAFNIPTRGGPALYSSTYDTRTPYFPRSVIEIGIQNGRVVSIHPISHGKRTIPSNGYMYVVPVRKSTLLSSISLGVPASITTHYSEKAHRQIDWDSIDNIIASTPLLIQEGTIVESIKGRTSDFYTKHHPRTAVGVLENGQWLFLVADGRQKKAQGFTSLELAQVMKELGCVHALNLDGGGSSTIVISGKVMNSPSGREHGLTRKERPLSNVFLISPHRSTQQRQ